MSRTVNNFLQIINRFKMALIRREKNAGKHVVSNAFEVMGQKKRNTDTS